MGDDTKKGPSTVESATGRTFSSRSGAEDLTGVKPLNGFWTTMMHLVKGYVGTGIFAMGDGFKNAGLICGPIMLAIIAIINLNCQYILIRTADRIASEEVDEVKPSFAEAVEYTLHNSKIKCLKNNSKGWGLVTNIFLCVCELGFCCVYFVFIAEHLLEIANNHDILDKERWESKHITLAVILLPMWASVFLGNLKLLLPLSIIANVLMWIGIIIVIIVTTKDGLPDFSERDYVGSLETMPLFFGTALFAFEGITFVIPLRNEMAKPERFTAPLGILSIGMTFVTFLYILIGFFGYWQYGEKVAGSIFLNITETDKELADYIDAIMSVGVMFTFTLHMYIPFEISFSLFYEKYGPFKHGCLVVAIYRSVPVLITFILANAVPFLSLFISLIGATTGAFLALIMPATLELIAFYDEISKLMVIKDVLFIIIGFAGMITGTVLSLKDIVEMFIKASQK